MEEKIVKLQFYRRNPTGGPPEPWIFEIHESTRIILNEYRKSDLAVVDPALARPELASVGGPAHTTRNAMQILGASTRPLPGGGTEVLKIGPRGEAIMEFFHVNTPCPAWIPDCARMRQRYAQELDALPKNAAGKCDNCDEGALMRKYIEQLDRILPK